MPVWDQGAKLVLKCHLGGQYCQMCDFGLKIFIFDPFRSLTLEGKKFLTFQTWLKKSLVSPTWGQGAKLAWKMSFKGVNMAKCAVLA